MEKLNLDEVQRELIYLTAKTNNEKTLLAIDIAQKCISAVKFMNMALEVIENDNKD